MDRSEARFVIAMAVAGLALGTLMVISARVTEIAHLLGAH